MICIPLEPDVECFDISLRKISNTSSWAFGSCSNTLEYSKSGVYIEKCCMPQGVYILSCNNHDDDDWSRSTLSLQGHEFCNDYVGNSAMIQLNLAGIV